MATAQRSVKFRSSRTYRKPYDRYFGKNRQKRQDQPILPENAHVEGIVLRYGSFYGPGTWFTPDGDVAEQVRRQQFPTVGNGEGVWSWVHIEDAAIATVNASEQGHRGIYLTTNDQPLEIRRWLPTFAQWVNAPPPP